MTANETMTARRADRARWPPFWLAVRPRKTGTLPGGSTMTNSVTNAIPKNLRVEHRTHARTPASASSAASTSGDGRLRTDALLLAGAVIVAGAGGQQAQSVGQRPQPRAGGLVVVGVVDLEPGEPVGRHLRERLVRDEPAARGRADVRDDRRRRRRAVTSRTIARWST